MRDTRVTCDCFFCKDGRPHPDRKYHTEYRQITGILLVSESLDPNDYIYVEACVTCSHKREMKKPN